MSRPTTPRHYDKFNYASVRNRHPLDSVPPIVPMQPVRDPRESVCYPLKMNAFYFAAHRVAEQGVLLARHSRAAES